MPASTASFHVGRIGVVGFGIALIGGGLLVGGLLRDGDPSSPALAYVNGEPITADEFNWYAGAFVAPDGDLTQPRGTILLSLVNQKLVAQEAARRSIAVPDARLSTYIAQVQDLEGDRSLAREGGIVALRYRAHAFLLMQLVRDAVIEPVKISESEVAAAYAADPGYANVSLDDARQGIVDDLRQKAAMDRWIDWLAMQRACAAVLVVDSSATVPSATGPGCRR